MEEYLKDLFKEIPALEEYKDLLENFPVPKDHSDISLLEMRMEAHKQMESETDDLKRERFKSLASELGYRFAVNQFNKLYERGNGDANPVQADNLNSNVQLANEMKSLVDRMSRVNKRCDQLEEKNKQLKENLERTREELEKVQQTLREREDELQFSKQEMPDGGANEEMARELEMTVRELKKKWDEHQRRGFDGVGGDSEREQRMSQENRKLREELANLKGEVAAERTKFEEWKKEFESQKAVVQNQGVVISGFLKMLREYGDRLNKDVELIEEDSFGRHLADKNPMPVLRCIADILEAINEQ